MTNRADEFELYDLAVVVESIAGRCTCDMRVGDRVELRSGKLSIPAVASFCLYALQSVIPLLPAKQGPGQPAELTYDSSVDTILGIPTVDRRRQPWKP